MLIGCQHTKHMDNATVKAFFFLEKLKRYLQIFLDITWYIVNGSRLGLRSYGPLPLATLASDDTPSPSYGFGSLSKGKFPLHHWKISNFPSYHQKFQTFLCTIHLKFSCPLYQCLTFFSIR